ncbi:hypothetical protein [Streptomyces sp. AN091965]|uniref:hypothetical protein n=1 Tax=Streptomyces sp. AN091965 TaxID=2927803 RepID=UPI001F613C95|nr:hypothetical protein [Streptomyces sp. AN091965]MCI3930198.1 hypothetical protein [Streptomyces sp. AN091965]
MKTEPDVLGWSAMLACIVVTAHGEWSLAVACGYVTTVAAGLPIAIDAYAIRAMRAGKEILPPVLLMVATNAGAHLVHGGMLRVTPWLIVLVSAIAPVVLWRVHALRRHESAEPESTTDDIVISSPTPVVEPVPETKPEPSRPVPVAVPEGARTLPTFGCRGELQRALRNERPALVPAAEYTRTRAEVHAEWTVPGDYVDENGDPADDSGAAVAPWESAKYELGWAATHFSDELLAGKLPTIRAIKDRLSVGQDKAKEVQAGFREALSKPQEPAGAVAP